MRGVGTQRTLVLIDGRRVPGLPTEAAGFDQGDFNAIPLGAVERVETLTSTAGGIHGPSAVGGVVNVVLRRDYRGADLTVVSGLSDRGDAGRVRFEGRIGFSPDEGRTDVMLFASYATAQSFHASDRDYARRALRRQTANSPATFLAWSVAADAVIVRSTTGAPLRLDPALGGATLSSSYTFLPIDFTGSPETRVAALLANSGKLPTNPPPGRAGERMSLAATPEVGSVLLNVRHKLSDRFELFADGLYFSNRGRAFTPNATTQGFTPANAPTNPFTDFVLFSFPTPDLFTERDASIKVRRFSGGLIASLPRSWQASADYTIGRTILHTDFYSRRPGSGVVQSLGNGLAGANGLPAIAPLGDFTTLQTAISSQSSDTVILTRLTNHFRDATVRAAGPLVTLPAGPLTLTLLGEFRREHIPQSERFGLSNGVFAPSVTPARTQAVRSGYVEVRAPLVPRDAVFVLARGLELQLALRRDDVRTTFPENVLAGATFDEGRTTIRHEASVFTVGGRAFPAPWLMLRGSLATGEAPPDLRHLQERAIRVAFDNPSEPRDPRRGGRRLTQDGPYLWIRGGSHDIAQEKGRTMSAGVVLNPSGRDGPRVSVDYSRIDVRDEIVAFPLTVQQLMDLESRYPDRVEREPLSAADAALGYTVGRVTALHTGLINAGRSVADAVDIQLDWTLPPTTPGPGADLRRRDLAAEAAQPDSGRGSPDRARRLSGRSPEMARQRGPRVDARPPDDRSQRAVPGQPPGGLLGGGHRPDQPGADRLPGGDPYPLPGLRRPRGAPPVRAWAGQPPARRRGPAGRPEPAGPQPADRGRPQQPGLRLLWRSPSPPLRAPAFREILTGVRRRGEVDGSERQLADRPHRHRRRRHPGVRQVLRRGPRGPGPSSDRSDHQDIHRGHRRRMTLTWAG